MPYSSTKGRFLEKCPKSDKVRKFTAWSGLDYTRHLPHTISFLPPEDIEDVLRDDYKQMQIGFIYANAPSFDEIMERLSELQSRFRTLVWKNNR